MKREIVLTGIGALMHFLVDSLCICCLYLLLPAYGGVGIVEAFLTYNILAFMTQPITGLWVDRIRNRHWVLLRSIVFLTLAVGVATVHYSLSKKRPRGVIHAASQFYSLFLLLFS